MVDFIKNNRGKVAALVTSAAAILFGVTIGFPESCTTDPAPPPAAEAPAQP